MIIANVKTVNSRKMIPFRLSGLSELKVRGRASQILTDQLTLSTKGQIILYITTYPSPGFSDLPTALNFYSGQWPLTIG